MTDTTRPWLALFAGASMIVLAACGGSSDTAARDTAETVETAAADAGEAVADAADAVEGAAADAGDAMADAGETAEDAAADAADAVESAAADAVEAADDAAADTGDAMDTAAAGATSVSADVVAAYEALEGDPAQGRRVFTKCMSCHVVQEGQNRVGPSLYGIIGREAGSIEGFNYSDANANSGIVWTEPTMFAYLEKPQEFIPGTIMAFPGLPVAQDRADVIAYIKQESN